MEKLSDPPFNYQIQIPLMKHPEQPVQTKKIETEAGLSKLLQKDLTFKGQKTAYATHNIHAFAAKFPPQLPRVFIDKLTNPGDCVFDPMVGSGTTLVEALLANRKAIGTDLDPLGVQIAQVKATPVNILDCFEAGSKVLRKVQDNLRTSGNRKPEDFYSTKALEFFHFWFQRPTIVELSALAQAIQSVKEPRIRAILKVVFSSVIITKSGGITRARDLAHTRPHRDLNKEIKDSAINAFERKLHMALQSLESIASVRGSATVVRADARALPLLDNSVHLVVTSPPYAANAIDYIRAHKFSLMWFGYEPDKLAHLRRKYIGSELRVPETTFTSDVANQVLHSVAQKDVKRAVVVAHYFRDIQSTLDEIFRVLIKGCAAIIVVGSSTIRGVDIKTPWVIAELAVSRGFKLVGVSKREIIRNARMMPMSNNSSHSGIEARMHEEGVVGLIRPD